ncbi:MAG: type I DNA topoisomerase [Phototrophicales bacterium]|nr:MAG: type I DNA topoisomerase [Phototrophicales bacterium]
MPKLVIVESPTKAKTIRSYLPKDYIVEACMGHIRDLPSSAKEIPAAYKSEAWSRLGVDVENDFTPLYVIPSDKKKVIKALKDALKNADELILATDEDREGESIGWHLTEVLKPKVPVKRMVFHEITKDAIQRALDETRDIDERLVRAQETRRILDRLVGYTLSPLLWKKIAPGLSAGRVQSVAVDMLVQRERERIAFRSATYWDLRALLEKDAQRFTATLSTVDGIRVASGRDFDEKTGKLKPNAKVRLLNEADALALRESLLQGEWRVLKVEEKTQKRKPPAPFTTSTLQQEANRKLRLSARDTMRIAQKLYEQGYITYMRTDSVFLSEEAINASRKAVKERYGAEYLSASARRFTTTSKSAQEAHEAIRPAGTAMRTAEELGLSGVEASLYDMIWKRTIATQMAEASLQFMNVTIGVKNATFDATGKRILFPGFFRAYVEGSDDPEAALDNQETLLPPLAVDDLVNCEELEAISHQTKPPSRYTEATLVQALEREGVGRPSTYASVISTIQERGYVVKENNQLIPTFLAFAVTRLLEQHFPDLVDAQFTARMEEQLDEIARGNSEWLPYLREFYCGQEGLEHRVQEKETTINPRDIYALDIDELGAKVRVGRYGPYLEIEQETEESVRASLPANLPPADLSIQEIQERLRQKDEGPKPLGIDPETNLPVYVLQGPYGYYVQLGEQVENGEKPKRTSLPKGMEPQSLSLEEALGLLRLPRLLGEDPETGKPVYVGIGRYGPYVRRDKTFKSLTKDDNVLTIDLERALELLATARTRNSGEALRELGEHPNGGTVTLYNGRYGPYVKYKKTNVSLPKHLSIDTVTLEDVLSLIDEKLSSGKSKKSNTTRKRKSS